MHGMACVLLLAGGGVTAASVSHLGAGGTHTHAGKNRVDEEWGREVSQY
jgi:hypothetical protein